jgi:hypothetical protein
MFVVTAAFTPGRLHITDDSKSMACPIGEFKSEGWANEVKELLNQKYYPRVPAESAKAEPNIMCG